jgi:hypothetical protein
MRQHSISALRLCAGAAFLGFIAVAGAHSDEIGEDMDMPSGTEAGASAETTYAPTYFANPDHVHIIYAHISLMVLAWVFILPVGEWIIQQPAWALQHC